MVNQRKQKDLVLWQQTSYTLRLHLRHRHGGVVGPVPKPKPEGRVHRRSEGGLEGVEVVEFIRGDGVERHNASRDVYINSYSAGHVGRFYHCVRCFLLVVPEGVLPFSADETPALVIPTQPAVGRGSFPADSFVAHGYDHRSLSLHLPVTAASQWVSAEQLPAAVVEAVWVIRVWLLFLHHGHRPVVIRQLQVPVSRVWVKFNHTRI